MPKQDNLNWNSIKNWLPIISSSIIVAGAFFSVRTELAVLTSKVDSLAEVQNGYLLKSDTAYERIYNHETRIAILESRKINQSGSSAQLTQGIINPTPKPEPIIKFVNQPVISNDNKPEVIEKTESDKQQQEPPKNPDSTPIIPLIDVKPILGLLGS